MRRKPAVATLVLLALAGPALATAPPAAGPMLLRDAFAEVNGVRLHYRIGGQGPPLVLLHGLGLSGTSWDPLLPHLAGSHTVVVPDLRGHGRSTNPSGVYRHSEVASDILQLLDGLGVDRFSGVGHSSGAAVFLHMATRAPARVEAMVLIALGHRVTDETFAAWKKYPSFGELPVEVRERVLRHHPGGERQVGALLDYVRNFDRADLTFPADQLSRIQATTLVVFGDRDGHPVELAVELYRALPHAQLWIVPGQAHFPFWPDWGGSVSAAAELPAVLQAFFGGRPRAGSR